jgi:hypothetical protein
VIQGYSNATNNDKMLFCPIVGLNLCIPASESTQSMTANAYYC